eukprot:GHVP01012053.1.p1 GENE.GHVP01012053.1~~GHVP01012053.1.p1  ORF type:complete len:152 (+),score=17.81 GHVP01012053.1:27-458(+)
MKGQRKFPLSVCISPLPSISEPRAKFYVERVADPSDFPLMSFQNVVKKYLDSTGMKGNEVQEKIVRNILRHVQARPLDITNSVTMSKALICNIPLKPKVLKKTSDKQRKAREDLAELPTPIIFSRMREVLQLYKISRSDKKNR